MGGGPNELTGGSPWAQLSRSHGLGCPAATGGSGALSTCPAAASEPSQQQDWFRGAQVVGIAVDMPYHVKTEGHTADCECPKCEPGRWGE